MTDGETLIDLLDRAGIVWTAHEDGRGVGIQVESDTGPANLGYNGFVTIFYFEDGTLVSMGAWE